MPWRSCGKIACAYVLRAHTKRRDAWDEIAAHVERCIGQSDNKAYTVLRSSYDAAIVIDDDGKRRLVSIMSTMNPCGDCTKLLDLAAILSETPVPGTAVSRE